MRTIQSSADTYSSTSVTGYFPDLPVNIEMTRAGGKTIASNHPARKKRISFLFTGGPFSRVLGHDAERVPQSGERGEFQDQKNE